MRISSQKKMRQARHGVAYWITVLFVTATIALIATLILPGNRLVPLALFGLSTQATGATNGADRWNNDKKVTAPAIKSSGNVSSTASFDLLSPNLSSYLTNLGLNAGAVVYDLTHQRTYTYNGSTPFIAASSMKVPIMLAFLDTIEQQGREPSDDEMDLLATMIENSDNDAASALFVEVGGAGGITTYMQKIGINNGLIPDDDAWGYSTITPQTMVDLLTLLHNGKILNSTHRRLALDLMENVEPDQQVGVGDTAPSNAMVALKDGWVTSDDDLWAVNSSGIVSIKTETYIVSVYTQGQEALEDGQDIARKVCSTVASLLTPS